MGQFWRSDVDAQVEAEAGRVLRSISAKDWVNFSLTSIFVCLCHENSILDFLLFLTM
jgi:hypothetical protein